MLPVSIQNILMKDFCQKNDLMFLLGIDEFVFPDCYLRLVDISLNLTELQGIVMCSMFMLPPGFEAREAIFERLLRNNCSLALVFESQIVKTREGFDQIHDMLSLIGTLQNCPTFVSLDNRTELPGDSHLQNRYF